MDLKEIWELQWPSQELSQSMSVLAKIFYPYKDQSLSLSCSLAALLKADDHLMHSLFAVLSLENRLLPSYPVFPVLKDPKSALSSLRCLVDAVMICRYSEKQLSRLSSPSQLDTKAVEEPVARVGRSELKTAFKGFLNQLFLAILLPRWYSKENVMAWSQPTDRQSDSSVPDPPGFAAWSLFQGLGSALWCALQNDCTGTFHLCSQQLFLSLF